MDHLHHAAPYPVGIIHFDIGGGIQAQVQAHPVETFGVRLDHRLMAVQRFRGQALGGLVRRTVHDQRVHRGLHRGVLLVPCREQLVRADSEVRQRHLSGKLHEPVGAGRGENAVERLHAAAAAQLVVDGVRQHCVERCLHRPRRAADFGAADDLVQRRAAAGEFGEPGLNRPGLPLQRRQRADCRVLRWGWRGRARRLRCLDRVRARAVRAGNGFRFRRAGTLRPEHCVLVREFVEGLVPRADTDIGRDDQQLQQFCFPPVDVPAGRNLLLPFHCRQRLQAGLDRSDGVAGISHFALRAQAFVFRPQRFQLAFALGHGTPGVDMPHGPIEHIHRGFRRLPRHGTRRQAGLPRQAAGRAGRRAG